MSFITTKNALTLEAAKRIAAAAHAEARSHQCNMAIAIVDDGANLLYLERMDSAQIGSVVIAQDKAQTAVRFKRSSKVFEDAVGSGRVVLLALSGATPIEGGLPIIVDGQVVGAIGVSGGTSTQDGMVAEAGLAALKSLLAS